MVTTLKLSTNTSYFSRMKMIINSIYRLLFGGLSNPISFEPNISKNNIANNFAQKLTRLKYTLKISKLGLVILQIFHFLRICMLLFVHSKAIINYMITCITLKLKKVKSVLMLREKYEFGWIATFQRIIRTFSRSNLILIKHIWFNKF